jgi:hypothetical protein
MNAARCFVMEINSYDSKEVEKIVWNYFSREEMG